MAAVHAEDLAGPLMTEDEDSLQPPKGRTSVKLMAGGALTLLFIVVVSILLMTGGSSPAEFGEGGGAGKVVGPVAGDDSIMNVKEHGTCPAPPPKDLRFGVTDWKTADHIR
jgi:hypothetical protein